MTDTLATLAIVAVVTMLLWVPPFVRLLERAWNAFVRRLWYALDCPPRLPFGMRRIAR